jgi:hypothetical protein
VKNKNTFDSILNTATILNFDDWQQFNFNRPAYSKFKNESFSGLAAILRFEEKFFLKKMNNNHNKLTKNLNLQVLNNKNVLTSIFEFGCHFEFSCLATLVLFF